MTSTYESSEHASGTNEPLRKRPSYDINEDNSTGTETSNSKVWEHFTELLEEDGAISTESTGVEVMLDSEPLIKYKSNDPLKW